MSQMSFQVLFDIDNPLILKDIFFYFRCNKERLQNCKSSNAVPYYFWPNCVLQVSHLQTFCVQDNPIESLNYSDLHNNRATNLINFWNIFLNIFFTYINEKSYYLHNYLAGKSSGSSFIVPNFQQPIQILFAKLRNGRILCSKKYWGIKDKYSCVVHVRKKVPQFVEKT